MKTNSKRRELGRIERAVYDLVRTNAMEPHALVALYRRELAALARHGLLQRDDEGVFSIPADATRPASVPPPPPAPRPEPMQNISIKVPAAVIEALELLGGSRSDIIRPILAEALPRLLEARTAPPRPDAPVAPVASAHGSGVRRAG